MYGRSALRFVGILTFLVLIVLHLSAPASHPMTAEKSLTIASSLELRSLNPISDDPGAMALMPLFSGTLLELDPMNSSLQPALAESFQLSDDRTQLTITLKDAKFSDGAPLTAADVLFTFQDILLNERVRTDTLNTLREFLTAEGQPLIQSVEQVDEHMVRFTFGRPMPQLFLTLLAQIPILPKHKLEAKDVAHAWGIGADPREVVGLGPFRVQEIHRAGVPFISEQISTLVLERNPFYWKRDAQGAPLPRLDRVIWRGGQRNILDPFRAGNVDLFEPSAEEAGSLPAGAQLVRDGPQKYFFMLLINQDVTDAEKRAIFRDPRFRQALAYAADKTAFAERFPGGFALPRESFIHPLSPYFDEADLIRYPFDLSRASALLDQVGLKDTDGDGRRDLNGEAFTLKFLLHRDDPARIEVAKIYQENLSKVGLNVELEITSLGDWRGRLFARPPRYEVAMATYTIDLFEVPSIILQLAGLFSSQGEFHIYRPSDASGQEQSETQQEIDQILTELPTSSDADSLFARLQHLLSESVPVIPLYGPEYLVAVQPYVQGADRINAYGYVRFLEFLGMD